jgi:hypothetical protein
MQSLPVGEILKIEYIYKNRACIVSLKNPIDFLVF